MVAIIRESRFALCLFLVVGKGCLPRVKEMPSTGKRDGTLRSKVPYFRGVKSYRNEGKVLSE